jgi:hypothetical protein
VERHVADEAQTGTLMEETLAALRCPRCARPMVGLALISDLAAFEQPPGEPPASDAPWGDDDEAPP